MTPKPRGVYRTQGEVGLPNTVLLEYGALGFNISEQEYRDNGYQPNFDGLPWGHEYHAAKKKGIADTVSSSAN
jgi:hypothetical protein